MAYMILQINDMILSGIEVYFYMILSARRNSQWLILSLFSDITNDSGIEVFLYDTVCTKKQPMAYLFSQINDMVLSGIEVYFYMMLSARRNSQWLILSLFSDITNDSGIEVYFYMMLSARRNSQWLILSLFSDITNDSGIEVYFYMMLSTRKISPQAVPEFLSFLLKFFHIIKLQY
ncbi:MAG: hypothetical protein ACI4W1_03600 [Ruminococcus sp.]